jgi:hypothetical protein
MGDKDEADKDNEDPSDNPEDPPGDQDSSVRSQNSAKHFQLFVWCTS